MSIARTKRPSMCGAPSLGYRPVEANSTGLGWQCLAWALPQSLQCPQETPPTGSPPTWMWHGAPQELIMNASNIRSGPYGKEHSFLPDLGSQSQRLQPHLPIFLGASLNGLVKSGTIYTRHIRNGRIRPCLHHHASPWESPHA